MFGTIRKHQTWLWAIIITLTIISFVIFFMPGAGRQGDSRTADRGSIFGKKVSEQEYRDAWVESHLQQFIMTGRWPEDDRRGGPEPEQRAYQWLLLVREQQRMGIDVSDEATATMARNMIRAFERVGVSSPQVFFDGILRPKGYTEEDFERFVRHFVGIQEIISTTGLAGTLVTPEEAKVLYQRDNQEVATEAAFFWSSNFTSSVSVTPDILNQYYTNRVASYAIPERVQVDYVHFNLTNYLPAAQASLSNLTELVEVNYTRMGTNAFPDAKTPEEAKAKLREQILREQARQIAKTNAFQFATVLFAVSPASPAQLKALAGSNNIPVVTSAPFDRDSGPADLPVGPEFVKAAFGLNADEPYSQVTLGGDGAYIMAMNKTLPRETPPLDQIRPRVEADYKNMQARMFAVQAARNFHQTLTNGLAEGKPFTNLCAAANIKAVELPPFAISTRSLPAVEDAVPLQQLKQAAFSTAPGQVSPFFATSEGAAILFVKAKLPLDQSKLQTNLPAYTAQLRRNRQQEAFDAWLSKETGSGLRDTPLARQQMGGAAAKR